MAAVTAKNDNTIVGDSGNTTLDPKSIFHAAESEETPTNSEKKKVDYNPRWKGYTLILILSLFNFVNTIWVPMERITNGKKEYRNGCIVFGIVTFSVALLIVVQDRSQQLYISSFHYGKVKEGYFEGSVLVLMVIWWIVGVAIITKPGGIAYQASNIYYSSWLTLFACIYTLNLWSGNECDDGKDILSLKEIVGVSRTLKSWWVLFLAACTVFGCSIVLHSKIKAYDAKEEDTAYGIALGLVSIIVSLFHILVHYNFFTSPSSSDHHHDNVGGGGGIVTATTGGPTTTTTVAVATTTTTHNGRVPITMDIQEGGYMELFSSVFLILIWLIGVAVLTQDDAVGATMDGAECKNSFNLDESVNNCTIIVWYTDQGAGDDGGIHKYEVPCKTLPRDTPGSNLYYAVWIGFLSSLNIALNWKRAQALRLASQSEQQQQ